MFSNMSISDLKIKLWLDNRDILIGLLLSSFFINCLGLVFPIALLQTYDRVIPNKSIDTFYMFLWIIVVAMLFEITLKILRSYVSAWANSRFIYNISNICFDKLIDTNIEDFQQKTPGEHLESYNSIQDIRNFLGGQNLTLLVDIPFIVIYLSLLGIINIYLLLSSVAIITLYIVISLLGATKLQKLLSSTSNITKTKVKFFYEAISGIHTIKSLAMEEQILRRYEKLHQKEINESYSLTQEICKTSDITQLINQLSLIVMVSVGGYLVIIEQATIGGLAATIILSNKILQPISKTINFYQKYQKFNLAIQELKHILAYKPENTSLELKKIKFHGNIVLSNVSFKYAYGNNKLLLNKINLEIKPQQTIAIHSYGSSAKSTLLYILAGLYKPTEGTISTDGIEYKYLDLDHLRSQICHIPESGELFSGNILDNLTLFDESYEEQAIEISKEIGLHTFIENMAQGYQTPTGTGTTDNVSKGITQQILVARAFLYKPKIILFDEANTALDIKSDGLMLDFFKKRQKECSIILCTHRPSWLKIADRHIIIHDKEIKEFSWSPSHTAEDFVKSNINNKKNVKKKFRFKNKNQDNLSRGTK